MNKAQQLAEQQRHYDRLHHLLRVEWLSGEAPTWSCGARVEESVRCQLLVQSRNELDAQLMSRAVDLDDAEYLAVLDAFAARA